MKHHSLRRLLGTPLVAAALLTASSCGATSGGADVSDAVADAPAAPAGLADTLRDNGLESLSSAVQEIDVRDLTDSAEFTFFAPDDEAFQALDADDIADLLGDTDRLSDVLRNHLVPESLNAAQLSELDSVETEGGATLDVAVEGDVVTVGGGTVVRSDLDVDSGVVHIVDRIFVDA